MIAEPRPAYTVDQAAELLQLHKVTVRDWVRSEPGNAARLGRSIRIPSSELDRLLSVPASTPAH